MNPLTRRASRKETRDLLIDIALVMAAALCIAVMLAGGV